jgi:hypothetical protein
MDDHGIKQNQPPPRYDELVTKNRHRRKICLDSKKRHAKFSDRMRLQTPRLAPTAAKRCLSDPSLKAGSRKPKKNRKIKVSGRLVAVFELPALTFNCVSSAQLKIKPID